MKSIWRFSAIAVAAVAMHWAGSPAQAASKTLTVWSHFADHQGVRDFFKEFEQAFEKENPDIDLKITFYEKNALFAAQTTALRGGQGPDIIYLEPDRMQFVDSGFVRPIDGLVDLNRLEDFAKKAWTVNGKIYGLGMQAFTVELYYDKTAMEKVMAKAGLKFNSEFQLNQDEFLKLIKTSKEMGITPIAQGIGDRPYPGSYLLHELLLRKIGTADYDKLWHGKLSFNDPRVLEVLEYTKQVVAAGAYPETFTTLKLGESHYYFHTKPGALMFPLGSWYSSRAFNPPDKGGQPKDFKLGIMQFPAMNGGACNKCKTIGVSGTYSINNASKQPEVAAKFLQMLTREEWGRKWVQATYVQTGVKIGTGGEYAGEFASYLKEMAERGAGREYFIGTPIDFVRDQCKETYIQVLNAGLPGGLLSAKDAAQQMQAACYKGG